LDADTQADIQKLGLDRPQSIWSELNLSDQFNFNAST
jgi:hypothetical protein